MFYRLDGSSHNDAEEGSALLGDYEARRVAYTTIGDVSVSTVFLVIPHPPYWSLPSLSIPSLYETMVFGGPYDEHCERYPNEVAALAGHDRWCAEVASAQTIVQGRARDTGQPGDGPERPTGRE